MWSRRDWGRACASVLLTAGLPGANAQVRRVPSVSGARQKVLIGVNDRSRLGYLPLTIAERLGYFSAEGLQVEVRDFGESMLAMQALYAREVDAVTGSYIDTLLPLERNQKTQSFVQLGRTPQIVLGVSTRTLGDSRDLRNLQGKRIGVQALDSGPHRLARMLVARAGLSKGDVEFVPLPTASALVEAFQSAQVDAICHTDLAITQLERSGSMRVVVDTRTVQGNAAVFGGPWPSGCLSALDNFLAERPGHGQALANAMVHALKWLQTAGPSDINKVVPEWYFQGDRGLYLAAFNRAREAWTPDGLMPEKGPETVVRNLPQLFEGEAVRPQDLRSSFTNEFALKAKLKFRA